MLSQTPLEEVPPMRIAYCVSLICATTLLSHDDSATSRLPVLGGDLALQHTTHLYFSHGKSSTRGISCMQAIEV